MKWIKENAGLFSLGILLSGVFLFGLNMQQKLMDVRFEAVETRFEARFEAVDARFEAVEGDLQEIKEDIKRLEVQLNQFIIAFVGKEKAAVIKQQAEDLFTDTRPAVHPSEKKQAKDLFTKTRPIVRSTKKRQAKEGGTNEVD